MDIIPRLLWNRYAECPYSGLPDQLEVTAWSVPAPGKERTVQGLMHKEFPIWGVQYHPEVCRRTSNSMFSSQASVDQILCIWSTHDPSLSLPRGAQLCFAPICSRCKRTTPIPNPTLRFSLLSSPRAPTASPPRLLPNRPHLARQAEDPGRPRRYPLRAHNPRETRRTQTRTRLRMRKQM